MFYLTGSCEALKLPNFNRLVDTWVVTHQARVGFRNLDWSRRLSGFCKILDQEITWELQML